jgi:hypothetical protein
MQETHVYHVTLWRQRLAVFIVALGILLPIGKLGGAIYWQAGPVPQEAVILVALWTVLFAIVGGFCLAHVYISTVTLYENAIELRTVFSRRRMPFDKIRGRRQYLSSDTEGGSTRYLKLESNEQTLPKLKFQKSYSFDQYFYDWFNRLPDLDARDNGTQKGSNFGLV